MKNIWLTSKLILISAAFLVLPTVARAESFNFDSFVADITINEDGSFDVEETITVNFFEERHGIYRTIPVLYIEDETHDRKILLTDILVTDENGNELQTYYTEDANLSIRIGDPDVTVVGPQTYVISYHVMSGLYRFESIDELYWNVTGLDWDAAPTQVVARVRVPRQIELGSSTVAESCYTGEYGSTAHDCVMSISDNVLLVTAENEFLTVAIGWPKDTITFQEPIIVDHNDGSFVNLFQGVGLNSLWGLLLPALVGFLLYRHWQKTGRDPEGRGTIVPEYAAPKDLGPTELGVVIDTRLDTHDLSAAIVYLAVRGHLKIREVIIERIGFDKKTFEIDKLESTDPLKPWEEVLLNAMFESDTTVTEEKLKLRLPKKKFEVNRAIYEQVVKDGYFANNPSKTRAIWISIGFVIAFLCLLLMQAFPFTPSGKAAYLLAFLPTGVMIMVAAKSMIRRTDKGVKAMEHGKGFKMFLKTAEKYRVEWQEKENVFEQFLPYAMIFKVADKWAKAFASVHQNVEAPTWYVSSHAFNPVLFTKAMGSITTSVATAVSPQSSGSSGGGSSGGGGGGGGGGSW